MIPAYEAIAAKAEQIGWPIFYRRDLTAHDRARCAMLKPSDCFLWVLYELGTHIIVAEPSSDLDAVAIESTLVRLDKCMRPCRYFWWDAGELSELGDVEEACFVLEGRVQEIRHRERASTLPPPPAPQTIPSPTPSLCERGE
jgi:hypothetical protein